MTQPHKFHLFNCDSIYELSVVEDLLKATKAKLGFEFSVEKHNFTLSEMSELSTKTIPEMQIDFAMFVVHAHESVLAINNDNLEYGYSKVYKALLQATGEKVIVVIGGDDNYKNETEEEESVISRWAWRKVAHPQFSAEFIDGRKSFVFSWNKKHRAIHEEALLHYFNPNKKGQKFEYQPKPKPKQAEWEPSGHRSPLQKAQSMSEQKTMDRNPLQRAQLVTEQRTAASLFSPFNSAEQRREDSSGSNILTSRANTAPFDSEQGARPKEVPPSSTGRTELKDLAILGCSVSAVMLKSTLRYGVISYQPGDVHIQCPGFEVPDYIIQSLLHAHVKTPEAEVIITNDNNGKLRWSVDLKTKKHSKDEEIQIAANETLMLKTRVRYGKISFEKDDVEFVYSPNWQIPTYILQALQRDYWATPCGELFVISDEKGNVRFKVNIRGMNRMLSFANKQLSRY